MENFNDKSSPLQMRELLKRVRGNYVSENTIKKKDDLTVRDMLKITRKLNEDVSIDKQNKATTADFEYEKEKAEGFLSDLGLRFTDDKGKPYLKITDDEVIWGGVVNGIIRFGFIVKQDKNKSKVTFDYTEDFSPDNPENDEIIQKIEKYYDSFYSRWIDKLNK